MDDPNQSNSSANPQQSKQHDPSVVGMQSDLIAGQGMFSDAQHHTPPPHQTSNPVASDVLRRLSQQPTQQASGTPPVSQQATPAVQQPVQPPVQQPVSGPHKEHAPQSFDVRIQEPIRATEQAPEIPAELKEIGVEATPDHEKPEIPHELQQHGVQEAKAAVPVVVAAPAPAVKLPMTEEQAVTATKSAKSGDSVLWLAIAVLKQIKAAHRQLLGKKGG